MASITIYPDAHPESTSVDGFERKAGAGDTWSAYRDATVGTQTTNLDDGASAGEAIEIGRNNSGWEDFRRVIVLFDASSIPSGATIDSATYSFVATAKGDNATTPQSIALVSSSPASNTELVAEDYDQLGTTLLATAKTISSITADSSTYNDMALNAAGLSYIQTAIGASGIIKLGLRMESDRANSEPSFGSGSQYAYVGHIFADNGSLKPKLVINYTLPVNSNFLMFMSPDR
jgi:hypothetical protein